MKNLEFSEDPNYEMLQTLLIDVLNDMGEDFDFKYDWIESGHMTSTDTKTTSNLLQSHDARILLR